VSFENLRHGVQKNEGRQMKLRIRNRNFSGKDLTGTLLDRRKLSNGNFDDCRFDGTNSQKDFLDLDFSNSKMRRINMSGLYLVATNFYEADLENANFNKAFLQGVEFSKANLSGANLTETDWGSWVDQMGGQWSVTFACDANFSSANLSNADLRDTELSGSNFTKANLTNADFSGANLENTIFTDAILLGTKFAKANLTNSNLKI
jgi:uncharacterized protein YjbI with pentapeptide repeats